MKKIAVLTLLLSHLLRLTAQQPDPDQVMNKTRELSITGSLSATVSLLITEKNGMTRSRTISMTTKSYPDGLEKRFIKFTAPADVKGTSMLIADNKDTQDDMWIYLPALKKTRRIVSSEKGKNFMSSEFSNADMSSPTLSDFRNRYMPDSGVPGQWVIESTPLNQEKVDEYGFTKKISYITKDNYQVRKMEFYNFENELFKVIEIKSVLPLSGGKYLIKEMTARNLLNQRTSVISFTDTNPEAVIDDAVFTLQNLER